MPIDDFMQRRGAPRQPRTVSGDECKESEGRVPDELIDFWKVHGVGCYADTMYRMCTPPYFDEIFQVALGQDASRFIEDFSAFGYSSLATVDLWHKAGRHFTLSLDAGLLMDVTSRDRTAAPPCDLEDMYRLAGLAMPENAREIFIAGRDVPEDIGAVLMSVTSDDNYRFVDDDLGLPLLPQLRKLHGELVEGEVYFRSHRDAPNLARHYLRTSVAEAVMRMPRPLIHAYAVEVEGMQEIRETWYPCA